MMQNPLNRKLMTEVGLTTDKNNRVIDDENREPLIIKDNYLKYSSQYSVTVKNNEQLFDPMSNKYQMSVVFDHFLGKISEEDTPVTMYNEINNGSAIEVVLDDGKVITTKDYNNDSLKYIDAIMQLNGSSEVDKLKDYDNKKSKTYNKRKEKPKVDFNK